MMFDDVFSFLENQLHIYFSISVQSVTFVCHNNLNGTEPQYNITLLIYG